MPELREVQVSARKPEDKGGAQVPGGLSTVRKEILNAIRAEEDVSWEDLQYYDVSVCKLRLSLQYVHSILINRPSNPNKPWKGYFLKAILC
jgi:hypothetical protein